MVEVRVYKTFLFVFIIVTCSSGILYLTKKFLIFKIEFIIQFIITIVAFILYYREKKANKYKDNI